MNQSSDDRMPGREAENCRFLAGLFRFLAGYFLEGPTERSDGLLRDPQWAEELVEAGLLDRDSAGDSQFSFEEHVKLFTGCFRIPSDIFVPPYEQAYRDQKATVDDSAVAQCEEIYERTGYDPAPYGHVQADHIGHQASFMAAVLEREAECLDRRDEEAAGVVSSWWSGFLRDHCAWWRVFAERAAARTRSRQIKLMTGLVTALTHIGEKE